MSGVCNESNESPAQVPWRWRNFIVTYLAPASHNLTRKTFTICKTTIVKDLGWELGSTAHLLTLFAGLGGECSRVLDPRLNAGLSANSTKEH